MIVIKEHHPRYVVHVEPDTLVFSSTLFLWLLCYAIATYLEF